MINDIYSYNSLPLLMGEGEAYGSEGKGYEINFMAPSPQSPPLEGGEVLSAYIPEIKPSPLRGEGRERVNKSLRSFGDRKFIDYD